IKPPVTVTAPRRPVPEKVFDHLTLPVLASMATRVPLYGTLVMLPSGHPGLFRKTSSGGAGILSPGSKPFWHQILFCPQQNTFLPSKAVAISLIPPKYL